MEMVQRRKMLDQRMASKLLMARKAKSKAIPVEMIRKEGLLRDRTRPRSPRHTKLYKSRVTTITKCVVRPDVGTDWKTVPTFDDSACPGG